MKRLFGAVVALVAVGGSAFAEDAVTPVDAVWANAKDAAPAWMTIGNWTDGEGAAIARPPTNVADSATFPVGPVANGYLQQIKLDIGNTSSIRKEIGLASLVDENPITRHAISLAGRYYSSCWEASAWLTLLDPNRFNGYITSYIADGTTTGTPGFGIRLPATAGKPLSLAGVSLAQPVDVQVPTAGTKASIGELYESGTLRKIGAGELVVNGSAGAGTTIYVMQGSLTLGGHGSVEPEADDDVPVKGAWMHLDANRTDTMKWYVDPSDGRTYVTNWCDVRGNGVYAYFNPAHTNCNPQGSYVKSIHPPFANDTAVSGRRIVDFGRCRAGDVESWGPVNCALSFSETRKNIREVFCVGTLKYTGTATAVLGCWEDGGDCHPFHAGGAVIAGAEYGDKAVVYGDIIRNGLPSGNGVPWPDKYNLGVVSIGCTNNIRLSAIGNERNYADRVGGVTVGELILFTNELTHAERMLVHRYLQRKWMSREHADRVCEAGAVTLASDDNSIGVPEGRTAVVQEVNAAGGTLVKTGKGALTVGALSSSKRNTAVKVDVRGGTVKFGGLPAVTDVTAPAADPWLWLKAERKYFTPGADLGDGKEHIGKWVDCRAEQSARYGEQTNEAEQPFVRDNAVGDLAAVDFGAFKSGLANGAYWMNVVNNGGRKVYDGFVVQCEKAASGGPVFGNVNCDFYSGGMTRFIKAAFDKDMGWTDPSSAPYGGPVGRNALWTENGTVVDPVQPGQVDRTAGDWNVFGVSTLSPFSAAFLGNVDREKKTYGGGGCQIGEVIYYDRKLTPDERRQTIAYLMDKWQKKTPAFADETVRVERLSFADGEDAVIDTDRPLEVGEVVMSGGTLVKRGTGVFEYPHDQAETGFSSLAVEGGRFAFKGNPLGRIVAKTAIHYDATDVSKMDYFVTEDGDGSARTNLVKVYDQRLSANYAKAFYNPKAPAPSFTNPTLKVVQTVEGVSMPVFDFGRYNVQGLSVDNASKDTGSFDLTANSKLREAHVIYADTLNYAGGNAAQMDIFADRGYSLDYFRGNGGKLLLNNATYVDAALAGDMAVDGVRMPGYDPAAETDATRYVLPRGFHLVSAYPAPCEKNPAGTFTIAAMGNTHDCGVGGCQVGELIAFEQPLPAAESAYLQAALMAKWLGGEVPVWTNALESLTVAEGATLSIGTDDLIAADALEGAGTIVAGKVAAAVSLALTAGKPLTVDGMFVQDGALAVTVAIDYKPDVGEYPILTADSFEGLDLSTWSLSIDLSRMRTARFVRKGNTVCLAVGKTGFSVIVK